LRAFILWNYIKMTKAANFLKSNVVMFLFLGLAAAAGCGFLQDLGADAMETMPVTLPGMEDPETGANISPTAFWTTWALTLAAHEGRKFLRLFRKKLGNDSD